MNEAEKIMESGTASIQGNTDQEEDQSISPEVQAWSEKVLNHISRMAVDEEYRKQATSFLP